MTKSIRIKNSKGDKATIWPVGVHHYSVKWDNEQVTHTIASSQVDKSFYYGSWEEIENDELPDTFKFTVDGGTYDSYNAVKKGDKYIVSWGGCYAMTYDIALVKRYIEKGDWKIIEESFAESATYHQGEKIIPNGVYKGNLSGKMDISSDSNLLQTLKQFVEEFDAQVEVCKKGYLVYSDNCTIDPYRANSDEELKEILQAIRVLKKYEGV